MFFSFVVQHHSDIKGEGMGRKGRGGSYIFGEN
jgi:hypothetical protein